jgi:FkbM family methyltransferase
MMTMEPLLGAMARLGIYRQARLWRNRYLRPELGNRCKILQQFYSQFIRPGDLVFDIGANRGDRTEVFVEMGARVVAVEPLPLLAARLQSIFRYSPVNVEAVGIGRVPGALPLHVCTTSSVSSFSQNFIENRSRENFGRRWDRVEVVPIVTADNLIEKHGSPAFLKIDVEGFEREVLAGLNHAVPGLSFEVHPEDAEETMGACLDRLGRLSEYEFNICLEERLAFELPDWIESRQVIPALHEIPASVWTYGDIYARKKETRSTQNSGVASCA